VPTEPNRILAAPVSLKDENRPSLAINFDFSAAQLVVTISLQFQFSKRCFAKSQFAAVAARYFENGQLQKSMTDPSEIIKGPSEIIDLRSSCHL
jgi:hypothetical protein